MVLRDALTASRKVKAVNCVSTKVEFLHRESSVGLLSSSPAAGEST